MAQRVPGARALIEEAAVELYAQRGSSGPTAAEIVESDHLALLAEPHPL